MQHLPEFTLSCPAPIPDTSTVIMGHGGGGRLMQRLIEGVIGPAFSNPILDTRHDCAMLQMPGAAEAAGRLAFTTDSYVVSPLFFPGGDIGSLAINGTVNDLAMGGARPRWISVGFIIEEGLPMETLRRVVASMRVAADAAGVQIVTGDTKVVDHGKGDSIFINTAGIGIVEHHLSIGPSSVRAGDAILVSGDIGRHGITIMAMRDSIAFESAIESDCAPLWDSVHALLAAGIDIHCLRDLTRGGLTSALVEVAETGNLHLHVEEAAIPVMENVAAACELLGFDPMSVANEGRFVAFVPSDQVETALAAMRAVEVSRGAALIGQVADDGRTLVTLQSVIGCERIVDMISGEQLPRIC